jgi:aspartyl/asparaginyl beta-hydroxylase (cupin superfamily)
MTNASHIVAGADLAVASGDLPRAQALLTEAAGLETDDASILLKLAAVLRAVGQPQQALVHVHRALAIDARDFTALLVRASLLEQLGDPDAVEAWNNALVQKPDAELPPSIAATIARAEQRVEQSLDARDEQMRFAMQKAESRADPEERERLLRFRSNVLRRTRPYRSEPTQFHYPQLAEREIHPRRLFPWMKALEAATSQIGAELQAVMRAERAELEPYIQYEKHQPLDQWRELNGSRDWTAIHVLQNGLRVHANARHCPQTLALLEKVPQPIVSGASPNAMFSLLAPRTRIPPHTGVANTRLVCHLPLVVPHGCGFRVGSTTREWRVGEAFVFDDTIEHEAWNDSDELRAVLIFDVWVPALSTVEREGIAALVASSGLKFEDA